MRVIRGRERGMERERGVIRVYCHGGRERVITECIHIHEEQNNA